MRNTPMPPTPCTTATSLATTPERRMACTAIDIGWMRAASRGSRPSAPASTQLATGALTYDASAPGRWSPTEL